MSLNLQGLCSGGGGWIRINRRNPHKCLHPSSAARPLPYLVP